MAAPSYPLALPITIPGSSEPSFVNSSFSLKRNTSVAESPFTGNQQVQQFSYALWTASLTCPPMTRTLAGEWTAFFTKLRGREGTFLLGDPDAKAPIGNVSGTVTIDGAHSVGDIDISISCTTTSITDAFKAGDYIQIGTGANSKLHLVVSDASISAGSGTVTIEPPLKSNLINGTTVTYNSPKGVFRMDSADQGWSSNNVSLYGISFSCTEAL